MTRAAASLLLLVPLTLFAADQKPDPKAEAAALKGRWKVAAAKFDGKELGVGTDRVLVFDEKQFTAFDGEKKGRTLGYTLTPGTTSKQIDLAVVGSDLKAAGIYERAGDKLTLCYGEPDAPRPKNFESKPDQKVFLVVLTRVKP